MMTTEFRVLFIYLSTYTLYIFVYELYNVLKTGKLKVKRFIDV